MCLYCSSSIEDNALSSLAVPRLYFFSLVQPSFPFNLLTMSSPTPPPAPAITNIRRGDGTSLFDNLRCFRTFADLEHPLFYDLYVISQLKEKLYIN